MFKDNLIVKNRDLRNFCVYRLIFGISYTMILPIIPLYFKEIGFDTILIGTIASFYGISKTITQLPFGVVTNTLGDKKSLKFALILMSILPIGYVYSKNSFMAASLYVLQGGILGMAAPATYSILARVLDTKRRGESTGFASAVFTLGGGIGALISGVIVNRLNNFDLVFYIASFGIFISFIYLLFLVPKNNYRTSSEKIKNRSIIKELKKEKIIRKTLVLASIAFLGDYIYGCILSLIHFYGTDVLKGTTAYTSFIISVYLLVFGIGAPIAGMVSDKIGNKKNLNLSFFVMSLSLLGLYFIRNKIIFLIIIIIYFLGATFLNASLQSELSKASKNESTKGFVFGLVGGAESLGFAVGPLISSYLYNYSKDLLFLSLFFVTLIVSLFYFLNLKK